MDSSSASIQTLCCIFISLLVLSSCNQPEPKEPNPVRRKSPIAIAKITHEPTSTYLKIVYGQPYKRDRDIFGNVVPYDQVWRTGANEATELTTTKDILFGGKELEAGTYTLFSIPHKNENWTIILNNELGQWGAFDYNEGHDEMRIEAKTTVSETTTEAFTIQFSDVADDSANIILRWDKTEVKIPVKFINSGQATSP